MAFGVWPVGAGASVLGSIGVAAGGGDGAGVGLGVCHANDGTQPAIAICCGSLLAPAAMFGA